MRPAGWRALLLTAPLSYGLLLGWQEWVFRQAPPSPVQALPQSLAVSAPSTELNTLAVATVLGLTAQDNVLNSAEPLTLKATLVASGSESRALLAGPDGERFYRAGERLPGGSVLRRIETVHVVLWRQGREEQLRLRPTGTRFLQAGEMQPQAPAPVYLQPAVEQSRSE